MYPSEADPEDPCEVIWYEVFPEKSSREVGQVKEEARQGVISSKDPGMVTWA